VQARLAVEKLQAQQRHQGRQLLAVHAYVGQFVMFAGIEQPTDDLRGSSSSRTRSSKGYSRNMTALAWVEVLCVSVFGSGVAAFFGVAEFGGRGWDPAAAIIACRMAH
jgi:hypothetical protein